MLRGQIVPCFSKESLLMINKDDILKQLKQVLKEGQFFVDIKEKNGNEFSVFVDDFAGLDISECRRINKQICSAFDRETEDFALEVSSPGLSKAFKVHEQYLKNLGKQVEVLCKDGEKIIGELKAVGDQTEYILIEKKEGKKKETQEYKILIQNIKSTKSVIIF